MYRRDYIATAMFAAQVAKATGWQPSQVWIE